MRTRKILLSGRRQSSNLASGKFNGHVAGNRALKRARKLLVCQAALLDGSARERLSQLRPNRALLRKVHEFRDRMIN
jgi:hypothetical protein